MFNMTVKILPTRTELSSATPGLVFIVLPIMIISELIFWAESNYVAEAYHIPAPVIALMIAAVIAIVATNLVKVPPKFAGGLQFSTRWLLKVGIVLYGINFSYALWFTPGAQWILVIGLVAVSVPGLVVYFLRKPLNLDSHSSALVAVGTGVCGISAIVATQQALNSDEEKAGMALATILLFGTLVLFAYPFLGALAGLDTSLYGLWTGATTLDLPQLVAAALQGGGQSSLLPALWVKSIRIGLLVPVILILVSQFSKNGATNGEVSDSTRVDRYRKAIKSFPLFILAFLGAILLNTLITIPSSVAAPLSTGKGEFLGLNAANLLLMAAIIAICFRVRYDVVGKTGWKVVVLGGLSWGLQSLIVFTILHYVALPVV